MLQLRVVATPKLDRSIFRAGPWVGPVASGIMSERHVVHYKAIWSLIPHLRFGPNTPIFYHQILAEHISLTLRSGVLGVRNISLDFPVIYLFASPYCWLVSARVTGTPYPPLPARLIGCARHKNSGRISRTIKSALSTLKSPAKSHLYSVEISKEVDNAGAALRRVAERICIYNFLLAIPPGVRGFAHFGSGEYMNNRVLLATSSQTQINNKTRPDWLQPWTVKAQVGLPP